MKRDAYDPRFTGWMHTDAVKHMDCPRCQEKAGDRCRQPSGRLTDPPHNERCMALTAKFGDAYWRSSNN